MRCRSLTLLPLDENRGTGDTQAVRAAGRTASVGSSASPAALSSSDSICAAQGKKACRGTRGHPAAHSLRGAGSAPPSRASARGTSSWASVPATPRDPGNLISLNQLPYAVPVPCCSVTVNHSALAHMPRARSRGTFLTQHSDRLHDNRLRAGYSNAPPWPQE